ncbi:hypothetical protein E4T56_gene1176 [Termitomyces sp. T112]|nr:hypothetical protein E4T56_gene1176 [Termitomyces sp. T112]
MTTNLSLTLTSLETPAKNPSLATALSGIDLPILTSMPPIEMPPSPTKMPQLLCNNLQALEHLNPPFLTLVPLLNPSADNNYFGLLIPRGPPPTLLSSGPPSGQCWPTSRQWIPQWQTSRLWIEVLEEAQEKGWKEGPWYPNQQCQTPPDNPTTTPHPANTTPTPTPIDPEALNIKIIGTIPFTCILQDGTPAFQLQIMPALLEEYLHTETAPPELKTEEQILHEVVPLEYHKFADVFSERSTKELPPTAPTITKLISKKALPPHLARSPICSRSNSGI